VTGGVDVSAAFWVNACTRAEKRAAAAERRAMEAEQERDALDALVNDLTARVVAAEQENARLSIKLTVSELDVEHWAASDAAARAQLRSLLDFAERHQLSYADHDHDCYELWCIERDYTRRLITEAPDA